MILPVLSLAAAISALTDVGVLPAIGLAAVVMIAQLLYKRFRS